MNNKNFKEFIDNNRNLKLTDKEKSDIFNNVSRFVEESPSYATNNKKYAMIATVLLVGVGAGTSFAASNALPGSILYPLKDEFNKKVLGISEDTKQGNTNEVEIKPSSKTAINSNVKEEIKGRVASPKTNNIETSVIQKENVQTTVAIPVGVPTAVIPKTPDSVNVVASATANIVNKIVPATATEVIPQVERNTRIPSITIPHI